MKSIYISGILLSFFLFCTALKAQEYERIWGTYFGPAGTSAQGISSPKEMMFDSQNNIFVNTLFYTSSATPVTYYNQFLVGAGNPYTVQQGTYGTDLVISASGNPSLFGYFSTNTASNAGTEYLVAVDSQENRLYLYRSSSASTSSPTTGTWIQTNPLLTSKNMLVKKNPAGSVVWSTFLPGEIGNNCVRLDQSGNIFITGQTLMQDLSTPGVLQENFDIIYSQGNIIKNPYLAKITSSGQLLWATYLPSVVTNMIHYNDSLYLITGTNFNPSLNTMATPGVQQTSTSSFSITKMNAVNGQRTWGTYYGPSLNSSFYLLYDLDADENGLYLTGTDYNMDSSNFFATPGAYKTQVTGGSDLFVTRFSHSGNLVWSTYFGGNGNDINTFDKVIDVQDGEIFISGSTEGSTNNLATPGSYRDAPDNMNANTTNQFFAKFNTLGNLMWSSYYGGSSTTTAHFKSINITRKGNSIFLYGSTNANSGFSTEGSFMPSRIPDTGFEINGFFARLDLKQGLSTSENNLYNNLILYNNPNNGVFTVAGDILTKEKFALTILDASGRQVAKEILSNSEKQKFDFSGRLSEGNYLIQIADPAGKTVKVFKMLVHL